MICVASEPVGTFEAGISGDLGWNYVEWRVRPAFVSAFAGSDDVNTVVTISPPWLVDASHRWLLRFSFIVVLSRTDSLNEDSICRTKAFQAIPSL